jgi:hypothetical protein
MMAVRAFKRGRLFIWDTIMGSHSLTLPLEVLLLEMRQLLDEGNRAEGVKLAKLLLPLVHPRASKATVWWLAEKQLCGLAFFNAYFGDADARAGAEGGDDEEEDFEGGAGFAGTGDAAYGGGFGPGEEADEAEIVSFDSAAAGQAEACADAEAVVREGAEPFRIQPGSAPPAGAGRAERGAGWHQQAGNAAAAPGIL